MEFSIGEKVAFLYEVGEGIIRKMIDSKSYMVEDDAGFERTFQENELVKIHGRDYKISD